MKIENIEKKIGILIREIRSENNLSQEDLAEMCGLHRTYIGSIERGEKNITVKNLQKIILSLNYSLDTFFVRLKK